MMKYAVKLFKEEDGQAMTEYGLLVGLISIAAIAAILLIGPQLERIFDAVAKALTPKGG